MLLSSIILNEALWPFVLGHTCSFKYIGKISDLEKSAFSIGYIKIFTESVAEIFCLVYFVYFVLSLYISDNINGRKCWDNYLI